VQLTGITNFRDMGGASTASGKQVRTGVLYRSGHLADATDDDLHELERLGIRTLVDLRGPTDIDVEGRDRLPAGARLVSIPMFERDGPDIRAVFESRDASAIHEMFGDGQALELMVAGAAEMVTSPVRCQEFGMLLESIAADGATPAVIHCSAGKDRTGWAASLILTALGVDRAWVEAHYLASNDHRRDETNMRLEQLREAGIDAALLEPLFGVHAECVDASLRAVDEHWGGIEGYLHDGLKVSADVVARLREHLLE
jgi:protein-tyrosine phosphatase